MQSRVSYYYNELNENVFKMEHYQSQLPVKILESGLNTINANDKVSAQSNIIPHIANRDFIYHFPFIKDANVIAVLEPTELVYPLDQIKYQSLLDSLKHSPFWEISFNEKPLLILKLKDKK